MIVFIHLSRKTNADFSGSDLCETPSPPRQNASGIYECHTGNHQAHDNTYFLRPFGKTESRHSMGTAWDLFALLCQKPEALGKSLVTLCAGRLFVASLLMICKLSPFPYPRSPDGMAGICLVNICFHALTPAQAKNPLFG